MEIHERKIGKWISLIGKSQIFQIEAILKLKIPCSKVLQGIFIIINLTRTIS